MTSDPGYDFLDEPFTSAYEATAPVNAFTVAGVAQREPVAANVLAFLLDPNERHGFGTTFVDALLRLLHGTATSAGNAFDAHAATGSSEWSVAAEAASGSRRRFDVLLENDDLDVALVISQHPDRGAAPAESYLVSAARAHGTVVAVTLVRERTDDDGALPFDDLFDAADAALYDAGPMADARSIELYAQFRETMSERIAAMTIEHEQRRLDELWSAVGHRQDQVLDFFTAIDAVNTILVARSRRLQTTIDAQLDALGVDHTSWVVNAGDHAWGRSRGERALAYVGISHRGGGAIELLVGWLPRTGTFGYAVKAYQHRDRPPRPWDHIPLGLPIDADEDAVADRFVLLTQRWLAGQHPEPLA